ncbi:MAG: methylated-DNA--[protein]-cysteine S-methyltransferase [Spirochaetota bacterium]
MALVTTHTRNVVYTHSFASPVGPLHAAVDRYGRVLYLGFRPAERLADELEVRENKYACGELEYQLEEYFAGERREFSLDVRLDGTRFQRAVWSRLLKIGFGETATYGHVAQKIGRREAARAVGNAVATNPVAILVPCHRVVPAAGGLGNYALRGLEADEGRRIKHALLELEGAFAGPISSRTTA